MQLNCAQQASISTWVNSFMFTRGQDVCVLLLLARRRHCFARWAICWVLPRISSFILSEHLCSVWGVSSSFRKILHVALLILLIIVNCNDCFVDFVSVGVIYHSDRAVPGTADVVRKLKKLVQLFYYCRQLLCFLI